MKLTGLIRDHRRLRRGLPVLYVFPEAGRVEGVAGGIVEGAVYSAPEKRLGSYVNILGLGYFCARRRSAGGGDQIIFPGGFGDGFEVFVIKKAVLALAE
jgi:hypothetical protein